MCIQIAVQTFVMVFHKIDTADTRTEVSLPSRKVGFDQIVIALPVRCNRRFVNPSIRVQSFIA